MDLQISHGRRQRILTETWRCFSGRHMAPDTRKESLVEGRVRPVLKVPCTLGSVGWHVHLEILEF